jgi:excisionase family DNA binding protein
MKERSTMPRTITPAEAAKKLNVGRNFVYDLLVSGKLRAEKKGKQWCIPEEAIQERLERLATGSK